MNIKFTQSDLQDLEDIFTGRTNLHNKNKSSKAITKKISYLVYICTAIFISCSIYLYTKGILTFPILLFIIIFAIFSIFISVVLVIYNAVCVFVQKKWRDEFSIELQSDVIEYRGNTYKYDDFRSAVYYKQFIFLVSNNKCLVLKLNIEQERELEAILKKYQDIQINYVSKEKTFYLKKYMKS